VAAIYLVVWAVYLLVMPVLAVISPAVAKREKNLPRKRSPRIAIIVPAHEKESCIDRCIETLRSANHLRVKVQIFVVADQCLYRTSDLAEAAGTMVLTRNAVPRGKTYMLAWAIDELANHDIDTDLHVISDATTYVAPQFLQRLVRFWVDGEDIIIAHSMVDTENRIRFACCMGLTLARRNFQDLAREGLALSTPVSGRGMGFSQDHTGKYRWRLALTSLVTSSTHPTEDFRHDVCLEEHGYKMAFAGDAHVSTPLRASLCDAIRQGIGWEKGRIANIKGHARGLLLVGLGGCDLRKMIAALNAVPPVAVLIGSIAVLVLRSPMLIEQTLELILTLTPLVTVYIFSFMVLRQGQTKRIAVGTLVWTPVHLAWRFMAFLVALTGSDRLVGKRRDER
jgi:hypothetical protein